MSKQDKPYWIVSVRINYSDQTYWGAEVREIPPPYDDIKMPFVQVQADDEIGAFNEAQKVLRRLGFRVGA